MVKLLALAGLTHFPIACLVVVVLAIIGLLFSLRIKPTVTAEIVDTGTLKTGTSVKCVMGGSIHTSVQHFLSTWTETKSQSRADLT